LAGGGQATPCFPFFFFFKKKKNKYFYLFINKFIFFLRRWTRVAIKMATRGAEV
jgi:hypothetical protein